MSAPGEDLHADLDGGWLLPAPVPRTSVHTRSIVCRSFQRDDGMVDVDGRFIDTRPYAYDSPWRGACAPGSALHNMQLRLTLNRERVIVALEAAMKSTPYEGCADVAPNFQRLVGLSMARGFRKALREHLGGTAGCTHVLALLDAMAAAAVQSFASIVHAPRRAGQAAPVRVFDPEALIDTCYSYRADGPVLQRLRDMRPKQPPG